MNNDFIPDLVFTSTATSIARILINGGDGISYSSPGAAFCLGNPFDVALADLDEDGALDIICAAFGSNAVAFILNNNDGTGTMQPVP